VTVVCIHQPDFAPWLGFFDRLRRCDIFIVLDNVQFLRRGWHHRDRIRTAEGERWLTVPVHKRGRQGQPINRVEIDELTDWRRQHLETLRHAYARAPCFEPHFSAVSEIYGRRHRRLIDFNRDLIDYLAPGFDAVADTRLASELSVAGRGSGMLVALVRAVGGSTYLTGQGAREYLDESRFAAAGIEVEWQRFAHPVYPQVHGDRFVHGLSGLDCLFNCGGTAGVRTGDDSPEIYAVEHL